MKQSDRSFIILYQRPRDKLEQKWRACLAASDFATHYTAPEYFLEPSLQSKRPFAVLSLTGEEVTGVLTGVHERKRVQSGLSVRPQIAFRRDVDRARTMDNLVDGLLAEANRAKLVELFVWSDMTTLIESRSRQKACEGVVVLDLSRGPDTLFGKFSQNKRRNIKRAIECGVSVAGATREDEISEYYEVCVDWSRRKGLPIPKKERFENIFSLTGNRLLLLARHQGEIIAGVVIRFVPHGVMEYAANSSLENALHLRPNDLLHWGAIEWGCRQGMTKYSLGGTHLFLRKFGGQIVPTTRCRFDLSIFRRYTMHDWLAEKIEQARMFTPEVMFTVGRSLRCRMDVRTSVGRDSA
jgi:Acetyltransferase (GNAT) domain